MHSHRKPLSSPCNLKAGIVIVAVATLIGQLVIGTSHALEPTSARREPAIKCKSPTSYPVAPSRWRYSGVRDRKIVRSMLDCPCQVIVRSFRSKRTYECPC
jgi:hypothetical protein